MGFVQLTRTDAQRRLRVTERSEENVTWGPLPLTRSEAAHTAPFSPIFAKFAPSASSEISRQTLAKVFHIWRNLQSMSAGENKSMLYRIPMLCLVFRFFFFSFLLFKQIPEAAPR